MYGKHHSDEAKKKISEATKGLSWMKGENNPMYGSKANQGKHWYNNGEKNVYCYECPEGWSKGQLRNKKK